MKTVDLTILEESEAACIARMDGRLTRFTVPRVYAKLDALLKRKRAFCLDVGGVSEIDSAGVALLAHCFGKLGTGPGGCTLRSVSEEVAQRLKLAGWDFAAVDRPGFQRRTPFAESLGEGAVDAGSSAYFFVELIRDILYQGVVEPFKGAKPRFGIFVEQMERLGAGSAPIVLLVSLLVGLTTAFQSAYELRQFGANIYIADLVAISMMIELGPLITAILVAGRSGAAITAEIGTMRVNEELDALELIGIEPIQYLAVPRIYAIVITQPLLGLSAAMVGIMGGLIIAVAYLDLSVSAFAHEAVSSLVIGDLFHNLSKGVVFGFIIVSVGVFFGMKVTGGAAGVGKATTQSVVTSIFLIIVADCVFSFI